MWIKIVGGTVGAALLVLIVAYLAGVRVLVIQPIGAIPDGVTAIVSGVPGLNFVDSPDAYCERKQGYVNLICRGGIVAAVGNKGTILLKLPYNDLLYGMTGAPTFDR